MKIVIKIGIAAVAQLILLYCTFSSHYFVFGGFLFLIPLLYCLGLLDKEKNGVWTFIGITVFVLSSWASIANFWITIAFWEALSYIVLAYWCFIPILLLIFHFQNKRVRYGLLVSGWLLVEYYHLHGTLGCAYLPLGNILGKAPFLAQWYEYTGVLGGSCWLLFINIFLYETIRNYKSTKNYTCLAFIITIPILISWYLYQKTNDYRFNNTMKIAVIELDYEAEIDNSVAYLQKLKDSTRAILTQEPDLILWPESGELLWGKLSNLSQSPINDSLQHFLHNSKSELLLFAIGVYDAKEGETYNEVYFGETRLNVFSLALGLNKDSLFYFRTKQKYVPCEEYLPNTPFYRFLKQYIPQQGSYYSSLRLNEKTNPMIVKNQTKITPLICYEILHGDFTRTFTKNGSDIIVCVQNESWVESTHQERQMLYYSTLRSIENRKEVVKVSNKGLNTHINIKGEVIYADRKAHIVDAKIYQQNTTFYSKNGDRTAILFLTFLTSLICLFVFRK